jgi:membrane fusion protein (multidrug efflux system)
VEILVMMMLRSPSCRTLRLGALVAACIAAAGCKGKSTPNATSAATPAKTSPAIRAESSGFDPAGSTDVATVQVVTVEDPLVLPAQLYVDHDVVLAARTSGVLQQLNVDLGSTVNSGAVLASVESGDQKIAVAQAEAAFNDARRRAERVRALTHVGGATPADSESAEFALRRAALSADSARRELSLTTITAPFAGRIAARYVGPYRLVHAGDTLFRLTESGPLLARVHVPEGRHDALVVGARATVQGIDGNTSTAHIIRVAPIVDAGSGTREVVLAVDPRGSLRPGSAVTVRLGSAPRRVSVVPGDVISDGGYVVVLGGAQPDLRLVRVGDELSGGRREVLSGLTPGERVRRRDP